MHYTIKKLDNGKYWTRLSLIDRDGNRHQPSKTADTQRELKRWATDMIRKNEDGLLGKQAGKTIEHVVQEYYEEKQGILKELTLRTRRYALDSFLKAFKGRPVSSFTQHELTSWVDRHARERGIQTVSRNMVARHLNAVLVYALEAGYLRDKDVRIKMLKTARNRDKVLWTIEHIKQFETLYASEPKAKLFVLLAHTGLRSNEARSLGWEHIDFKNGLIHVKRQAKDSGVAGRKTWTTLKSGNSRTVPISNHLRKVLERWRFEQRTYLHKTGADNVQDLVFTAPTGYYLYDRLALNMFYALIRDTGLPVVTLHTLRHTYATLLIQQGLPLTGIQSILGHADLATTVQTYLHVTDEMKDRARHLLDDMYDEKTI